jgi:hypothetical protein
VRRLRRLRRRGVRRRRGGQVSFLFMYRYMLRESCSQFDSLPLTSLTISPASSAIRTASRRRAFSAPPGSAATPRRGSSSQPPRSAAPRSTRATSPTTVAEPPRRAAATRTRRTGRCAAPRALPPSATVATASRAPPSAAPR